MQGGQDQVACFGSSQCQTDGGAVAQLAHQQHIGVFTQAGTQARLKVRRVAPHFALVDQALLRCVDELDRVFQGQNVGRPVGVDVMQQGCQQRRFSAAGGACDQYQTMSLKAPAGNA